MYGPYENFKEANGGYSSAYEKNMDEHLKMKREITEDNQKTNQKTKKKEYKIKVYFNKKVDKPKENLKKEKFKMIDEIKYFSSKSKKEILDNIFENYQSNQYIRSIMVGDLIQVNNRLYQIEKVGFKKVKWEIDKPKGLPF